MTTSTNKVKRVTKRKIQIDIKEVEKLAAQGLTQEQIAYNLGISDKTLYNRKVEFAEVTEAIKRGRAKGIKAVANALFQNALGGDNTAAIFFLKARAGWTDKQAIEITGKDGGPIQSQVSVPSLDTLIDAMNVNNELVKQKQREKHRG